LPDDFERDVRTGKSLHSEGLYASLAVTKADASTTARSSPESKRRSIDRMNRWWPGSALLQSSRDRAEMVVGLLRQELPWIRRLPESEQAQCAGELIGELAAGADTRVLEPFARALAAWRSTAEVRSDPDLARRLQGPFAGDGDEIPRPHKKR
jgi:hypothetical protein